jgi:hypothetical protein
MLELTGQDYIDMLEKLSSMDLVAEMIKQTVVANEHMRSVATDGGEPDNDILFRYSAVYTEVINRLEK